MSDTALAQCSTITGPGMSSGGPCPQQRQFTPPRSGGGGGGTRYYYSSGGGGGGGGYNYGAAIGAAGAIIEAAPAAINVLGGILSTGADIVSGVAETGSGMIESGADAVSNAVPNPDNGTFKGAQFPNPFQAFSGNGENVYQTCEEKRRNGYQLDEYEIDYCGSAKKPSKRADRNRLREELRRKLAEKRHQDIDDAVEFMRSHSVTDEKIRDALRKKHYKESEIDEAMQRSGGNPLTNLFKPAPKPDKKPQEIKTAAKKQKPSCQDEWGPGCEQRDHFLDRMFGGHLTPVAAPAIDTSN